MSVTRDFDAMLAEKNGEKPTFKVAGQEFTLRAKLPYAKFHKLVAALGATDDDDDMAQTREFFKKVLVKADRDRFLALLNIGADDDDEDDDEQVVDIRQMQAITEWAFGHFTGKAPSSGPSSSPGSDATGARPNVISLSSKQPANAG